jgi:DNA-binding NtrC family response regulator
VRVISATNRDLKEAIESKDFRRDLFYRINAVTISLPPLTERRDDIPLLVEHFLKKQGIRMKIENLSITPEALKMLQQYSWPGNIRQLENEIERASLICDTGGLIDVLDLSEELRRGDGETVSAGDGGQMRSAVEKLEHEMIVKTLQETGGNIQKSSRLLGLTRKGLKDKMARYGISAQDSE